LACAQAPAAGTYALFGYYIAPTVQEEADKTFICSSTDGWTVGYANSNSDTSYYLFVENLNLPDGTVLTFTYVSKVGDILINNSVETAIVNGGKVNFSETLIFNAHFGSITFTLTTPGCSRQFTYGMA
jgi:hypothetical protein